MPRASRCLALLWLVIPEFQKMAKILYTHLHRKKMVEQSDVLKQFLASTYSNHILHLCASESEKTEDSKNHGFPRNETSIVPEI